MKRQTMYANPRPLAAAVAAACAIGLASASQASEVVGQVSLLIGAARVVHMNGSSEPLRRGAAILVGDRVETSANGHVHLRFIDNGSVSVRPDSVLEVQAYRYDADKPQSNEVRLRVEQGTTRAISGAATELDKSRFRLNTPIAAIGVRGTDFIVHTDASGVRATVADGAIVVGALGGACSAQGLGPCTGADSRVLSADMGRLMAEVRHGERVARVVPANAGVAELAVNGAEERAAALYAAETAARAAAQLAADTKGFAQMRDTDRAAADLLAVVTPQSPVNYNFRADLSSQLIWGHWGAVATANDTVSVPYVQARDGRDATSAHDSKYGTLFRARDPNHPDGLLDPGLDGKFDFNITRATASYQTEGRTEAATVNGGKLSIDFGKRTFATVLALSSASGVKAELRAAHDIAADGTFAVADASQKVSGAVSFDGKEAGYLFERSVIGGLFRGKTLWGR